MEGVGARLGRSSTRYGPATVFSGPVRKWKKTWINLPPQNQPTSNTSNGNNGSHILLYKWSPLILNTKTSNVDGSKSSAQDLDSVAAAPNSEEHPLPRRCKYVPVAVFEEQKDDLSEKDEDDVIPNNTDPDSLASGFNEKPDINDSPMEETQVPSDPHVMRQDLNESTLDLSLGLKSHDGNEIVDQISDPPPAVETQFP